MAWIAGLLASLGWASFAFDDAMPIEYVLDNGIRVRLVLQPGDNQALVILGVRAGFLEEPAGRPHLAHITEHLTVFDLNAPLGASAQARFEAGKANGETLADLMYFDLQANPEQLREAIEIQAARLNAVVYSQQTLARELPRALGEIDFVERAQFPSAGKFALAPFTQAAFHGATDVPLKALSRQISVEDVKAFHDRNFLADRAMLIIVGEFDPLAARKVIAERLGAIPRPMPRAPRPPLKPGERKVAWDVATSHVVMGWPIPAADHEDHPALTLASLALFERLMFQLGASGTALPSINDVEGVFLVNVQARPAVELNIIKDKVAAALASLPAGFSDSSLERSRRTFAQLMMIDTDLSKVVLPARVSRTMARANIEIQRMAKSLVWGDFDAYRKRLEAVKPEAARLAARRYLAPELGAVILIEPKRN